MNIKKTFQSIFRIQGIIFLISVLLHGLGGCTQAGKSENSTVVEVTRGSQESQVPSDETLGSSEDSETLYEITDSTLRKEISIISQELGITESDALKESVRKLHERGCKKIDQAEKINEDTGWICFSVVDTDQKKYYVDTNKKGYFGTILTEAGYDNAHRMSEDLEISWNRNLLYSAEKLEKLGCGSIQSVTEISNGSAIRFSLENKEKEIYKVSISKEGVLGEVSNRNGDIIFREQE